VLGFTRLNLESIETVFDLENLLSVPRINCPDLLALHKPETSGHVVQFYEDDTFVIENVSYLAAKSLTAGDSSFLVATGSHFDGIQKRLTSCGLDLNRFREAGRYVALDAAETLSQCLVDGWPDEAKFNKIIGGLICRTTEKSANGFVLAFGEMVAIPCFANRPAAAVRLEQLWNALAWAYNFSLCCAYPLECFGREPDLNVVFQICAEHSLVIPAESPL
jgi:MEDS: MEthanogen/methylotroph, DcmR Sensory domain